MAFMQKLKQMLGIGGVKVKVTTPNPRVERTANSIAGSIELNSKSDQLVTKLVVKFVEHRTTGSGNDKKHQTFDLGETLITQDLTVKAGVPAQFEFTVPFALKTITDQMRAKGGVLGVMGKIGSMVENERSEYKLTGSASVKGRMMAASGSVNIKLI